jgi:hypothetical protein
LTKSSTRVVHLAAEGHQVDEPGQGRGGLLLVQRGVVGHRLGALKEALVGHVALERHLHLAALGRMGLVDDDGVAPDRQVADLILDEAELVPAACWSRCRTMSLPKASSVWGFIVGSLPRQRRGS